MRVVTGMLLVVEVLFVAVFVAGVAAVYWPAALMVAGALGVLAVERAQAQRRTTPGEATR